MGASLFLVVGPVNIGSLLGNSSTNSSASKVLDEQAERIEKRLAKNPKDEQLLLALTRARISAGNAQIEVVSETEVPTVTVGARQDFEAASKAWNRYLKQAGDEPSPTVAQLVSGTFFRLAESGSTSLSEIKSNITKATAAQRIAAEQQPSIGSLSTLAIYEYFSGEFAAGDKAAKQAEAKAPAKSEATSIEKQLTEYRQRAKKFQTGVEQAAKQEQKAGKEALQNPFGGLGGVPGG
ncbi:MAG TPA: hypothetical protein VKC63_02720 [Solirubrobacterales bacterium]|nr:hypothetical protein [Solirubrobacterales bacterium]